jgi:hypothetical protein
MRPALYTLLVGLAILAFVALVLVPKGPFPGTPSSGGEGMFLRCAPDIS